MVESGVYFAQLGDRIKVGESDHIPKRLKQLS